jgi:transcriptional regulator with XRE-family HTH domain
MADFPAEVRQFMQARGISLRELARVAGYDPSYLSKVLNGHKPPTPHVASRLDAALDAAGVIAHAEQAAREELDRVKRRQFGGVAGGTVLGALFAEAHQDKRAVDTRPLALALTGSPSALPGLVQQPGIAALSAAVTASRHAYQACCYSHLAGELPGLIAMLDMECARLPQPAAYRLAAEAFQVASGLLLKIGDYALATLAADRSIRAARSSEDPVTVASSARAVTHALMTSGHAETAVATARSYATLLGSGTTAQNPESLSVYGALLLRGAIAAAGYEDRGGAHELLAEAGDAACRLGSNSNLRWTAFGPVNVQLHEVSIAVMLGDAGAAVSVASRIPLASITVTERRASLLIDVARAFLQWGKHERALTAMRGAWSAAPEEVAGRPAVRDLARALHLTAPPSVRRDARKFSAAIGAQP